MDWRALERGSLSRMNIHQKIFELLEQSNLTIYIMDNSLFKDESSGKEYGAYLSAINEIFIFLHQYNGNLESTLRNELHHAAITL